MGQSVKACMWFLVAERGEEIGGGSDWLEPCERDGLGAVTQERAAALPIALQERNKDKERMPKLKDQESAMYSSSLIEEPM